MQVPLFARCRKMRVGLIAVDGHSGFPNLALMRISAWHRRQGDIVEWWNGFEQYDRVYMSKVFTFTPDFDTAVTAGEIITGGTGYKDYGSLPPEIEACPPDYTLYPKWKQAIIHLHPNDTAEFVFTNTKKPSLRLIKTSADGTPLDGVTFKITKIEDASHSIDRTTANGGEILVDDLDPGVYSVVETATLPDHILDKTEYHVELTPGKTSEIRLKNDKRPTLVIYKRDKDTGDPVPGVTFTLRGADGPTITT
ncbi:MAG: hypothetical protein K2N78_12705, partial [Oscillospiraceae bacterium]|nr:hypothetical protein [Oscillospiraceae bacterium]